MKIDPSKKYRYQDSLTRIESLTRKPESCETEYPWLTINQNGAALHHREDGTCPDPGFNLIESRPEPRAATELWVVADDLSRVYRCRQLDGQNNPYLNQVCYREILPDPTHKESLSLEVGKWYENRRGEKVGPLEQNTGMSAKVGYVFSAYFSGNVGSFMKDGRFNVHAESPCDLIREIPAPSEFPEVGARLRVKVDNYYATDWNVGDEVEVMRHIDNGTGFAARKFGCTKTFGFDPCWRDGLELVTEPPIPAGFPPMPGTPGFVSDVGADWIYAGVGPLKVDVFGRDPNISVWYSVEKEWSELDNRGLDTGSHYRVRRGSPVHRLQPWFHESQLLPAEPTGVVVNESPVREGQENEAQPEWRELGPDEVIQEGDELFTCGKWLTPIDSFGLTPKTSGFRARRRITPEQQAEGDSPTVEAMRKWMDVDKEARGSDPTASYPPPESEWPEKPDPGPGMVWERMPEKGTCKAGGKYIMLLGFPRQWIEESHEREFVSWNGTVVFRAVPAPQDPSESAAKAALEEGWLYAGIDELEVLSDNATKDIRWWDGTSWTTRESWYGRGIGPWAIRAGTDLAAKNGLEPAAIQRWNVNHLDGSEYTSETGEWVRYSDHVAAIQALTGKGGEK